MTDHPHRAGRKVQVNAAYGQLVHEVRLSFQEGRWLARIVTLPNRIWVAPGGRRALTFEAPTAEEAERRAAAFIEKDCIARGHGVIDPRAAGTARDDHLQARRLVGEFPLKFLVRGELDQGRQRSARHAVTANLSETGMFIATDNVLAPGSRISIDLELPGLSERLEGVVIWTRTDRRPGRRSGMGVRLTSPALSYRVPLQSLR